MSSVLKENKWRDAALAAGDTLAAADFGIDARTESRETRIQSKSDSLMSRLDQLSRSGRSWKPTRMAPCLHEIFERQADRTPDAIALECGDKALSYLELEEEANRMARYLRALGVTPGRFVGISLDRSQWPIITILAVLKSGGAYVPIEPSLPNDRIRYIAEAADLAIVVTEAEYEARLSEISAGKVVTVEQYRMSASGYSDTRLSRSESRVQADDICYVLFTSGTTGRPKGVVTEHRNVVHFVEAFNEVCSTTADDRVYQGFSLGFDGSVEEMWMAFSNGATLVCGDKATPRFGADLADYLKSRKITFLSTVPTLLSTLTQNIPSLRQLVVSGEACPADLVNRWCRPGLTMRNVYGPTEATVNTTASVLEAGKPVTIGRPLPGYNLHILDSEMRPVPHGEKGELYVSGDGLSRGYLNQPELTGRAFISWAPPSDAVSDELATSQTLRLYKTGDQVRWNSDGELEFFGRIDSQVKLRGFRIELSEIEAILVEQSEITSSAVKVYDADGVQSLAAYVLLTEGAGALDRSHLLAILRDRLPTYMVPAYLDVLDKFPMLTSGKVDRNRLPAPTRALVTEDASTDAEMSEFEERVAAVWAKLLKVPKVGPEQNFFTDLGGHSLLAAQLVTALRADLSVSVPVRDTYAHPTVRQLAAHIEKVSAQAKTKTAATAATAVPAKAIAPKRPWSTVLFQVLYMLSIVPLLALPIVYILPLAMEALQKRASVVELAITSLAVVLATWLALVVIAIAAKWTIIGRFRPGRYPLWGSYYLRWWIVSRLQHLSGMSALNGTPLAPVMWRLMGARVGRRCVLNPSLIYAWDCIKIGNDVSIGVDAQLPALRMEDGELVVGNVEIGERCFIGCHSALGLNVKMGADSRLDDQSMLPDGSIVPASAAFRGSPAQQSEVATPEGAPVLFGWFRLTTFTLLQLSLGFIVTLVTVAPVAVSAWLTAMLVLHYPANVAALGFLAIIPATMIFFALWVGLCKNLVYPNPKPGVYKVYSIAYLQHWLSSLVMQIAQVIGMPIFTTLYLPAWMRYLGARLGKHTEMSTVWRVNPDMLIAGDGVFFADGSMTGSTRTHLGRFEVATNEIGDRSFLGNSAILSTGVNLGSDCLLGVLSSSPHTSDAIPDGTDWLGSPGFRLPNRQKVTCFDQRLTYKPSFWLYFQRALIDGLRVVLPGYVFGGIGIASLLVVVAVYNWYGVWGAYTAIPVMSWFALMTCIGTVVGLKWLVMGRFKPEVVPLWSRYVWWNELINGLYETLLAPLITNFFGTPFASVLLRLMGCKIGRYCYIETALFSEFDLVNIGDHASLNAGTVVQNHLFEDRVMKSSELHIGEGCTIGNMSIVLYDTVMEPGAVLGPLSLLMKGETMPKGSRWHGSPTVSA
ncbi:Pls/PosA family non-ribosomal peptide synthetase [Filomicrobium sp.]|uniref:Pls/PosA family non-ribosomal peptide synthetase n=1 Tax=Filomicrobium sp. TaxID=2024831 RepID=UPI00258FC044|nr:Pls/PosA family non-ribosomal peptide synthetase [Filomicrobium sp.]MCV0370372.1 amino acid adenylation domain-containing protein [Filomicrobium sp.]